VQAAHLKPNLLAQPFGGFKVTDGCVLRLFPSSTGFSVLFLCFIYQQARFQIAQGFRKPDICLSVKAQEFQQRPPP
jgi:hypothetical protein